MHESPFEPIQEAVSSDPGFLIHAVGCGSCALAGDTDQQDRNGQYSLLELLTLSALGGEVPAFTPLSIFDFAEGWLTPWIPPPSGELHLERGGWVGADLAFFSREFDPAFTFNAGTAVSRDEFIGAATLFVPLNRRFQIGLTVPFVDSLQSTDVLPSATSFGVWSSRLS